MIIPQDCVKPMLSITDKKLRENFGVGSMFIFASNSGKANRHLNKSGIIVNNKFVKILQKLWNQLWL